LKKLLALARSRNLKSREIFYTQFMTEKLPFQEKFVSRLKLAVPENMSLADELADLLNVSKDSIYRRLRCQSAFSIDEIGIISERYKISVDEIIKVDEEQVSFIFNPLYEEPAKFINYMKWFGEYLTDLAKMPGSKIIYAADDVPVIQNFNYPILSAFKSFYWSKSVLNIDLFEGKKFNPDYVSPELLEIYKMTYLAYTNIERVEIWTNDTLNATLEQIKFYWDCDLFQNKDQALLLLNEIREMLKQINTDCEETTTSESKLKFAFYNSEVMIGNNCVLIIPGDPIQSERVFLGYNTFNSISTHNERFVKETRYWMDNLVKKSVLLSGNAEKQRTVFFRNLETRILTVENHINSPK
jgi:hypothetical protein